MKVKMKPTCDCGYVFDELSIVPSHMVGVDELSILSSHMVGIKYMVDCSISPYKCPQCGEPISEVMFQVPENGVFNYDVKKYYGGNK